jgi:hypothetical protein
MWYQSTESTEKAYLKKMNKAAGTEYESYEDFLADEDAVAKVGKDGSTAQKTALEYFQNKSEADATSKNQTATYLNSYLATQN